MNRRDGFAQFLTSRTPESPFLIERWSKDLETQVMVIEGDRDQDSKVYTDGVETWSDLRWPYNSGSTPRYRDEELSFSPGKHARRIGSTWWNWVTRRSVAATFDIDAADDGHAASTNQVTQERLAELLTMLKGVGYVTTLRSTGGKGVHGYIFFDPNDQPVANNHKEHTQVTLAAIQKLCKDTGFDWIGEKIIDVKGVVLWFWADSSPADHPGFTLIHEATKQIGASDLEYTPSETKVKAAARDAKPLDPNSPLDDYCIRAPWEDVLPAGWTRVGDEFYRPGKKTTEARSAILCTAESGRELLYMFSTGGGELKQGQSYSKAAVLAVTKYNGDFKETAAALREQGYGKAKKQNAASIALAICDKAELWHDSDDFAWATFPVGDHRETSRVDNRRFKTWLAYEMFKQHKSVPSSQVIAEATAVASAKAVYEGILNTACVRIAGDGENIYLDLANDKWEVVHIHAGGWEVIPCPQHIKFRRPNGVLPLPTPVRGGNVDLLRPFVNLNETSWHLFIAALIGALRPFGPYVIVNFISPSGSAKSTTMRIGRMTIDPNKSNVRASPHDVEALLLAATNGLLVSIDNSSNVPPWLADAICRVSTGGGLGKRSLYTNDEEQLFDVMRMTMISGITVLTDREDFYSRCLLLSCPALEHGKYKDEATFYAEFEKVRPLVLGALMDAVSTAIRKLPDTQVSMPRMADFFRWVSAAETGLGWEVGTFARHYAESQAAATAICLDNPVAEILQNIPLPWNGPAAALLDIMNQAPPSILPSDWPKNPRSLSCKLNRLKGDLAKVGILISQSSSDRHWSFTKAA